jgi:glycosyltransferase involved in cell wall biosynthesis
VKARFHPDLADAPVRASNRASLAFELAARVQRRGGWDLMMERNERFQAYAVKAISRLVVPSLSTKVVMSYSYAARDIFRWARRKGWRTVLAQIDPGPPEQRILQKLHEASGLQHHWEAPPEVYWERWREECGLADQIVVNSRWSEQALLAEGIDGSKIARIPLAYEASSNRKPFLRPYPQAFSQQRPMQVLFLGQVNLRKGVGPLLDAIRKLRDKPIEFTFVGPLQLDVPSDMMLESKIRWVGLVSHSETSEYYMNADLMIFPTFSDGFGLTQLEAQSWQLPVVASRLCGEVVEDGRNGVLLPEVSAEAIATTLTHLLMHPGLLSKMSESSFVDVQFSLQNVGTKWNELLD